MRTRLGLTVAVVILLTAGSAPGQFVARDPGPRWSDPPGAGDPIAGLTDNQKQLFEAGRDDFAEEEIVAEGLGPRFNLDSCAGCHLQPSIGGSSPKVNPQVQVARAFGAMNSVPSFIKADGPVREARFRYKADGSRDGGVHALFVISGRVDGPESDARDCNIRQEDFESEVARNNVVFRIPTPTFGLGLVEQIPDYVISANARADYTAKTNLGIGGRAHRLLPTGNPNRNGNDGTIARFGWKAQNKSLLLFSGEAYNVEMGITNELFQTERDETPSCQYATTPNDVTNTDAESPLDMMNGIQKFAAFMRFLAPPTPSTTGPGSQFSRDRGKALFVSAGCALCHTPTFKTGDSSVAALSGQDVNLYSDLLLHRMGPGLADDILQGAAEGDEYRTAPLWGLGQRIFFLHDGRTRDLAQAILAHQSPGNSRFKPSEANRVIDHYRALGEGQKQDLLNFLRSL
jgi:CxxC motif-containing protein (DUF1111 family)